jgi:hypothetical protein
MKQRFRESQFEKATLVLVLAALSSGACAQWVRVSQGESGVAIYVEPSTIRKNGDLRRYWELHDLAKADKIGNLSYRAVIEADCKEERRRGLQEDKFRGPMASGEISGSIGSPGEWGYVAPGSTGWTVLLFVCSR